MSQPYREHILLGLHSSFVGFIYRVEKAATVVLVVAGGLVGLGRGRGFGLPNGFPKKLEKHA